ncbi:MAG: hypothetical protein ACTHLE_08205 [Agriterribacter sp.]
MKKLATGLLLLLIVFFAWVYLYIPSKIVIKSNAVIKTPTAALHRLLLNNHQAAAWWPGNVADVGNEKKYLLNGSTYSFKNNNISLLPVIISNSFLQLETALYLISLTDTTVRVEWIDTIPMPGSAIKRIQTFFAARSIQHDLDVVLHSLTEYCSQTKNIYGFDVHNLLITDSTFIAISDTTRHYPSPALIYEHIDALKKYAEQHKAELTNHPILNIDNADSLGYALKVAIPLNKALPPQQNIHPQRMPPGVKILMAEIKGGAATAANGYRQLIQYARDRHLGIPGKPFYALVTDRRSEPDTTKWITRVYCPVR